jgi:UDP-N-acetylglucosamine 2-epimerase (non-hydrolysing)
MDKIFFDELAIPEPDYHLNVGSGTHGYQTGEMLKKIEEVLLEERPDSVLVFGDTNTTLAGGLAAAKLHVPLAHVEAGLRSYDRMMPEEINRVLTDHCSDLLFCPTANAVENLRKEGVVRGVHFSGDVTVDAIKEHMRLARKKSTIFDDLGIIRQGYYLATVHRAENTDDRDTLKNIVDAFCQIDNLVFPCHPRTEKYLKMFGFWDLLNERVNVVKPIGYFDMLMLESGAKKILTDSGGIQKEAYILGVPCITMRKNTEWVETLSDGWNVLVGSHVTSILGAIDEVAPEPEQSNVFGVGNASRYIAVHIKSYIKGI